MSHIYRNGPQFSIFDSQMDSLVCPVNCVGTMGKGLAKEFKERFTGLEAIYNSALENKCLSTKNISKKSIPLWKGKEIILFATKYHWKEKSEINYIWRGLGDLASSLDFSHKSRIAFPALGCGLGGLRWEVVLPILGAFCNSFPQHDFEIYGPECKGKK